MAHNHLEEEYDGKRPDISDHSFVIVTFRSGVTAALDLCMFAEGSKYQEEIYCVGGKGKIECHVPGPERMWPHDTLGPPPLPLLIISPRCPKNPVTIPIEVDEAALNAGDHNGATYYQHLNFLHVVRRWQGREGGREGEGKRNGEGDRQWGVEVDVLDGWWAVVMGLAAEESSRLGKAIEITPFILNSLTPSA